MNNKIAQNFTVDFSYPVVFTENIFSPKNTLLRDLLRSGEGTKAKVVFVVDGGLDEANPSLCMEIERYFGAVDCDAQLAFSPLIVQGGEAVKNDLKEFEKVLCLVNEVKIDRQSYIVAVGGGAVLDMVGFAASIAHRGVKHIRIPTTVLSQNDSGVGVKNGINYFGKKNFLGAFSPPVAVINDSKLLETLEDRDWRSGISEAIKVALIKDRHFFEELKSSSKRLLNRDP